MSLKKYIKKRIRLIRWGRVCKQLKRKIIQSFKNSDGHSARIINIGSPLHGNIGDHAIAAAMKSFFTRELPEATVVEIPGEIFRKYITVFQKFIRPSDCLVVVGGGFLGTLWMVEEEMVRSVVRSFPDNQIVIFPQTVFFDSSPNGMMEKAITRDLYQAHRNLHLWVRDYSIGFVKEELCGGNFKDILSAPDVVLYLNHSVHKFDREGVLLCFRSDKEKVVSENCLFEIKEKLLAVGESANETDTAVSRHISLKNREMEVSKILNEFCRSRLIITDRLHGMIFAVITGTPCIALNNYSGKVKGVWQLWLQDLPYIKFVDSGESIQESLLNEMLVLGGQQYDQLRFESKWREIANTLRAI